jgi:hypothetical protein
MVERSFITPPGFLPARGDRGELGGPVSVDPLTYLRVVELLAEAAGSVGWNVANNSIGQLVTLGLSDEGVHEIYAHGADTVIAGTAVMGGGRAVPVDGGYRVTGRWPFGTGCQESSWMLGSFQILDGDQPRRSPDGASVHWRGVFARSEAQIVEGSWDVLGLRATGSFDWTVEDIFLPERRTMVHAGVPLDNQWKRWPGISFAVPAQAWVGPHHSSVITGIARAGIDALIELASEKTPRGRTARLCDDPQVQDAVGRADTILNAGRATAARRSPRYGTPSRRVRILPSSNELVAGWRRLRRRQRSRGDGSDVPARWQHVVPPREPPRRVLARSPRRRAGGHAHAGVGTPMARAGLLHGDGRRARGCASPPNRRSGNGHPLGVVSASPAIVGRGSHADEHRLSTVLLLATDADVGSHPLHPLPPRYRRAEAAGEPALEIRRLDRERWVPSTLPYW